MPITANVSETAAAGVLVMDANTAVDERRTSKRLRSKGALSLTPLGGTDAHRCCAEDISTGGLFVCLPADYALKVGQRVEVILQNASASHLGPGFTGEACYATVVRTQRLADRSEAVIGAGLRFDQPLFLDATPQLHTAQV